MGVGSGWERYSTSREYKAGETIFEEGDPGDHLYVIVAGRVAIIKNAHSDDEVVLGHVGAGELIGEVSLLRDQVRSATATAVEPTSLLAISREGFWNLFDEESTFSHLVMNTLIKHLLVADESRQASAASERGLSQIIALRQGTTAFIVHDLQNPLNVVSASLAMIESDPTYDPNSEIGESVAIAKEAANRMLVLVESLLDAERLDRGTFTLDLALIRMPDLAEEVVARSQVVASQKRIRLEVEWPAVLPPAITLDRMRIDRVLTNLLDNALKFTPAEGRVWVDFLLEPGRLVVGVNDTGPGVPPDQRERIFDRFVQTDPGRRMRRGFGLGLAYCQLAVHAHGGKIWVEDGLGGVGTRFAFSLPVGAGSG